MSFGSGGATEIAHDLDDPTSEYRTVESLRVGTTRRTIILFIVPHVREGIRHEDLINEAKELEWRDNLELVPLTGCCTLAASFQSEKEPFVLLVGLEILPREDVHKHFVTALV